MHLNKPLVSIIIPNYNHSAYLKESVESALGQTYPNVEVIVNDNMSSDSSIEVLSEYIDRGVIINKNAQNNYNYNYDILDFSVSGKYFVLLCADDILHTDFVEKAVRIMEENENIGFVHGERDYIDEHGVITELDPFFNCSFICAGKEMLPIFTITDVGQSAQAVIRTAAFEKAGKHDTQSDHLNIDREQWFRLALVSDYAYIRDKEAYIRMPEVTSETTRIVETFYHPIALYHTAESCREWGEIYGIPELNARADLAIKRFAHECIGFTKVFLKKEQYAVARQYLLFMKFADAEIENDEEYCLCKKAFEEKKPQLIEVEEFKKSSNYSYRKRSYNPPENYILLESHS